MTQDPSTVAGTTALPRAPVRVLVLLGGIPLHGQERGNIEVFRALKPYGVEALFVTHEGYGHESVQPFLDGLGLRWMAAPIAGFWSLKPRVFAERVREFVAGNRAFVRAARAFDPTYIHAGNERNVLNILPAIWWLRRPFVFRLGDVPRSHRWEFRAYWRRLIAPSIDTMVCNSEFVRKHAVEAGLPEEKLHLIRNAPPVRPPRTGPPQLPEDLAAEVMGATPPFDGRTVVYVGQLSEMKGVDLLVEAARRLCMERDDLRFLIAGDYTWQNPFACALMDGVKRDGLEDRIRFIGFVEDIPDLLSLADVVAVPSVWEEPLANVVSEAKQARVPAVVFPSGGLPEIIAVSGEDGIVCRDRTTEALADGLWFYLDLDAASLTEKKQAAFDSLERLGLTEHQYVAAWKKVYGLGDRHDDGSETPAYHH